jgi:hypothetical protein
MCNPPRVTAGLAEALGGKHEGDSRSAWRDSPACIGSAAVGD